MPEATKKPRTFIRRGFGSDGMRPLTYSRTTPEALKGLPVFVVVFTVIMARDHMGGRQARQRLLDA
jgi:hypothetical protein